MNTAGIKDNWNGQKERFKKQYAILTGNNLMSEEGKKNLVMIKHQYILDQTKEQLRRIMGG